MHLSADRRIIPRLYVMGGTIAKLPTGLATLSGHRRASVTPHPRNHDAYFLGANDPYQALKTTLKAEIDQEAWESLHSAVSRPFPKPATGRIAVEVINHSGDEVMKVFKV